ncbi:MAG: peptidase, partial [Cyanobacteria bacterium P01_A01_bin.135]
MTIPGYYRFPTVHRDRVVFVCEDDLWQVPLGGGAAVRLTAGLGEVSHPAFSPNGEQLAFVGREDGQAEVYVMPASGGSAQRLTFLGVGARVVGWSPDGQWILFASSAGQPFRRLMQLHRVHCEGGLPERLPYGMAHTVSYGPDGGVLLGRNIGDPARWKRYRGGLAGVMWIDANGSGRFEKLLELDGNIASPMWVGDRIYFLSDHEGTGNLYACTPSGEDLQRLTHQQDYYLRNASTDGQRIVYHAGAELGYYDIAAGEQRPIFVEFYSPKVQQQRKFVEAGHYLEAYSLHPKGHKTLVTSRGQSFSFGHWEGAVMPLKPQPGDRYRLTQWLHGGTKLVAVRVTGDRTTPGDEHLVMLDTGSTIGLDVTPQILRDVDVGRVVDLKVSPTANQVVLTNQRHELIWVDLETHQSKVLDRSPYQRIHGVDWSPDGVWVAYGCSETQFTASIKLCQVASGQTHPLTPPRFLDFNPSFDPQGKFLYFLSIRDLNPVYDGVYFDLGFPRATRPFLLSLQQDTLSPFIPQPKPIGEDDKEDEEGSSEGDASKEGGDRSGENVPSENAGDSGEKPTPITIDLDGIQQRVAGFPVPEGRYQQIQGIKAGVLFSSAPVRGSLGEWHEDPLAADAKLELYDFKTQSCDLVAKSISDFAVGWDHNTLIYRAGDRLRVCAAKAQEDDEGDDEPSRKSGWLDLERLRPSVLPQQEWQQMLAEIWGLQRDHFWTADLSGVDWQRVYQRYQPLLARV